MKKIFLFVLVFVVLAGCLSACALDDEGSIPTDNWSEESLVTSVATEPGDSKPNQTLPSESVHVHEYKLATCILPQTCVICGETNGDALGHAWKAADCESPETCTVCALTQGNALGHAWKDATCNSPKTCTNCNKTEGKAGNHKYSNGKCTSCGAKDPDYSSQVMVWIPTNGGTKYHSKSSCSNMKNPIQVTKDEAIKQGYEPCKRCH